MANLEKLNTQEFLLEDEINAALKSFSIETMALKKSITKNKETKERTKEEMKDYLDSGELRKRMDVYIKINGKKIDISDLEMDDASGMLKIKYNVLFGTTQKEISSYFKIVGETNNNYIQFINNPTTNIDVKNVELFKKDGKELLMPEDGYRGGKIFDINIIKTPNKEIDIRVIENSRKTKENLYKKIQEYTLQPKFTAETFKDETLENTNIETLAYTQLGEKIVPEGQWYYREIFMRDGKIYREIGKIYFNEKWEVDMQKTKTTQKHTLLNVAIDIEIDTKNNSFELKNIDILKNKILEHRKLLSEFIGNSEFGDYTIFEWFNRERWTKRTKTRLLWLELVDDMYTFKRWTKKEKDTINFGFTKNNELTFKDNTGKEIDPFTLKTIKANKKEEYKNITIDKNAKKLLIQDSDKEQLNNKTQPDLENEPSVLTKNYLYSQNESFDTIRYHTKTGKLITQIPTTRTEKNEWKLETLAEDVQIEDLYKDITKKTTTNFWNLNIIDSDVFWAFNELRESSKINISARKVVRVLDKSNIYKYYTVEQKKTWAPFVFELDQELYKESERIMNIILENIKTIEKIENTQLKYRDKKEKVNKSFTQFIGENGLLPITTAEKIEFLKNTNNKTTLTKEFIRGSTTADIKNFPVNFVVEKNKITVQEKTQSINDKIYTTKLKEKDEKLTLRFMV